MRKHARRARYCYWYLPFNKTILCPACESRFIDVRLVWCGCKIPRKHKKWAKGRQNWYRSGDWIRISKHVGAKKVGD